MTNGPRDLPSLRARILVQLGAGVLLTILLLGLVELISGIFVPRLQGHLRVDPLATAEGDTVSDTLAWIEINPVPMVKSLDLLWRLQPLATRTTLVNPRRFGRNDTWSLAINSEGVRGPERASRGQRDGVYRILCVGDSVTFGYNVDQDDIFPRRLEALLRAQYPDRRFEVINAAVPGWSWMQGLRYLELEGLALHPNLVIAAHGTNDRFFRAKITDNERIGELEGPWLRTLQRVSDLVERSSMYRVAAKLVRSKPRDDAVSAGCERQIRENGSCHRVAIPEIEAAVRAMQRQARAAGVDLLLLNLDFQESAAVRGLRSAVEKDHIPFLDFVARFSALRRADEDARARALGLQPANRPPSAPGDGQLGVAKDHRVLLRVVASGMEVHSAMSVQGAAFPLTAFPFEQTPYDDGTHGDEVANDHVFSAWTDIAGTVSVMRYKYHADGVPEFQPLPPLLSAQHDRVRPISGDVVNPVEVFGEQPLMVERAHPDRSGHAVIASDVADQIVRFPGFAACAGAPAEVGNRIPSGLQ